MQRIWNYWNILLDDGMSYGDYVELLTHLLFLKMDQVGSAMPGLPSTIPEQFTRQAWGIWTAMMWKVTTAL